MEIRKKENDHRFVLYDGEKEIGHLSYDVEENGDWIAEHTVVDEAYGGRGLAKKLVNALIEEAKRQEIHVRPVCSYVKKIFAADPERVKTVWKKNV
ncbi:GNAT family N-acetyltransferase [Murdochiella vaginalis]|uniref:GNAT family N-acetyltransferase n=1 Tax=Murdochiella vaginalis TaxID=1852373 RepID=UPI0008FDE869|nr:GNAT family N-acetyltransferase [Murdochiella vaginalis]